MSNTNKTIDPHSAGSQLTCGKHVGEHAEAKVSSPVASGSGIGNPKARTHTFTTRTEQMNMRYITRTALRPKMLQRDADMLLPMFIRFRHTEWNACVKATERRTTAAPMRVSNCGIDGAQVLALHYDLGPSEQRTAFTQHNMKHTECRHTRRCMLTRRHC